MNKKQHNFIIFLLIAALLVAATANAMAGVSACMPKSCCCTKAQHHQQQPHLGQKNATPAHCLPADPAPCCQIEQDLPTVHLAIASTSSNTINRLLIANVAVGRLALEPQTTPTFIRLLNDGRQKPPTVPIYLQIQSILC